MYKLKSIDFFYKLNLEEVIQKKAEAEAKAKAKAKAKSEAKAKAEAENIQPSGTWDKRCAKTA